MVFCRKPPWPIHPSNTRSSLNHTGSGDKYFCLSGGRSTLAMGVTLTVSRWWFINFQSTHDECFSCAVLAPRQLAENVCRLPTMMDWSSQRRLLSLYSTDQLGPETSNILVICQLKTEACWLDQCVCLGKALLYRGPWIGPATGDSFGL